MIEFSRSEIARYYRTRVPHLRQNGAEWRGPCPVHHGTRNSFAVEPATGRWFCHSACARGGDIFDLEIALGGNDFPNAKAQVFRIVGKSEGSDDAGRARIEATYDYTDVDGRLLFQVVRLVPKDFRQR